MTAALQRTLSSETGQRLVFIAELLNKGERPDANRLPISRQELKTLRKIAQMLAQAMVASMQDMSAQVGLIGLTRSVGVLATNIGRYNANNPQAAEAKEIRENARDVQQNISAAIQHMGSITNDAGLKQTLISSLNQLKDLEPKGKEGARVTRLVTLRSGDKVLQMQSPVVVDQKSVAVPVVPKTVTAPVTPSKTQANNVISFRQAAERLKDPRTTILYVAPTNILTASEILRAPTGPEAPKTAIANATKITSKPLAQIPPETNFKSDIAVISRTDNSVIPQVATPATRNEVVSTTTPPTVQSPISVEPSNTGTMIHAPTIVMSSSAQPDFAHTATSALPPATSPVASIITKRQEPIIQNENPAPETKHENLSVKTGDKTAVREEEKTGVISTRGFTKTAKEGDAIPPLTDEIKPILSPKDSAAIGGGTNNQSGGGDVVPDKTKEGNDHIGGTKTGGHDVSATRRNPQRESVWDRYDDKPRIQTRASTQDEYRERKQDVGFTPTNNKPESIWQSAPKTNLWTGLTEKAAEIVKKYTEAAVSVCTGGPGCPVCLKAAKLTAKSEKATVCTL